MLLVGLPLHLSGRPGTGTDAVGLLMLCSSLQAAFCLVAAAVLSVVAVRLGN